MAKRRKTVFILGAGFSMPAGVPSQANLLGKILSGAIGKDLEKHRRKIKSFIKDVFGLTASKAKQLDLEDIYTPIHQSIARNQVLKGYSPEALNELETSLNILIGEQINTQIDGSKSAYVDIFAQTLVDLKRAYPRRDSFAVFSLNWDIMLDRLLFQKIQKNEGVVDYCCHCAGIDGKNNIKPALLAIGKGEFTFKLLKLHGSLNWLNCSECGRLFINRSEKIARGGFDGMQTCRLCSKNHELKTKLDAALLLPTFQKEMAKFHFQHIWNQAAIELSEATKLVFIGYSFPLADFDFRSLITRFVGEVEVDVVLWSEDGSETDEGIRYKNYFGDKISKIYYDGVEKYVDQHLASNLQ